ncbi:MAG: hypothetical protein ABL901_18655 [Hyphomicrobiaceae bacterium]|nr:hypothetical protein [Hyphomicrobiaceae bacterium]
MTPRDPVPPEPAWTRRQQIVAAVGIVSLATAALWIVRTSRATDAIKSSERTYVDAFWSGRVVALICGTHVIYRLRDGTYALYSRTTNPDKIENINTVCGGKQ